jgi:hypothetical protein
MNVVWYIVCIRLEENERYKTHNEGQANAKP